MPSQPALSQHQSTAIDFAATRNVHGFNLLIHFSRGYAIDAGIVFETTSDCRRRVEVTPSDNGSIVVTAWDGDTLVSHIGFVHEGTLHIHTDEDETMPAWAVSILLKLFPKIE